LCPVLLLFSKIYVKMKEILAFLHLIKLLNLLHISSSKD